MTKRELRKQIFQRRDRLSGEEIREYSRQIARRLYGLPEYRESRVIMFFLSFRSEVDTRSMVEESLARGKEVLVPKALPDSRELIASRLLDCREDLAPGAYGIPEPKESALRAVDPLQIDLLIVPGVAFSEDGRRLGYGGGYYDRFFGRLRPEVPLLALAFELQIVPEVPVQPWDRPVDLIVTEKRVIRVGRR
ncbi:MAG: 5-formyltetrahydrofolate cyclo-ligase [Dethiobacteria bacterium]|nr:5-formyltetrahydrofolate cyclo-ligase [Bacillota bacterium]